MEPFQVREGDVTLTVDSYEAEEAARLFAMATDMIRDGSPRGRSIQVRIPARWVEVVLIPSEMGGQYLIDGDKSGRLVEIETHGGSPS